ncbi:MAG TPA: type II secretion system F family protein [Planctomycetota bacterium]|jgi:type IV pilus assembly protein PilC|nr:type II secretion system F family protein [Planctomycetota bacterium]
MPTFNYTGKDAAGRKISGTIDAASQSEAADTLRRRRVDNPKVKAAGKSGSILTKGAKPKKGEVELFTRQLSTMVSAGIPLLECLEILQEQAESIAFKAGIKTVIEDIRSGSDLSAALASHPKLFTSIYVSMVRAGEASGQLDEILSRLADYLEATARLKREIKSAMTYPVVSLVLVLGITGFLMLVIVPKFKDIFDGLGVELPGVTQAVMGASMWMKDNVAVMLGIMVASAVAFSFWKRSPAGRRVWDRVVLSMPVFGNLFRKVALSRFSRTFSTMIKSGVPILGSLEIVGETSGNTVIQSAVAKAMDSVRQGETLSEPLSKERVFPPMVVRMIGIGERSGALESLLGKISEFYDQQVEAEVKGLTSLIEPLMIMIMGFVVGGIVLAVFLPIMKLQEALTPK